MGGLTQFEGETAAELYEEGLAKFRICARLERTRNGPAMVMPAPSFFTLRDPTRRVLDDKVRNANPFFHMMEFIWMMSGSNQVEWLLQFNKRMGTYADQGTLVAAYGYRWRKPWGDQVARVIEILKNDPSSRQAVIQMWEPGLDLHCAYKDKACNTQLLFRYHGGALDMLVVNRSNDFVWGALGANIVHLTMLHELIAHFAGLPLGTYSVISNNLHMYTEMPNYESIANTHVADEIYKLCSPSPLFREDDVYEGFIQDCENFVAGNLAQLYAPGWLATVALPVYVAWKVRDNREHALESLATISTHLDWRYACSHYLTRKTSLSSTSTEP